MVRIRVRRLDPSLPLPAQARPGDAGVDLVAAHPAVVAAGGGRALIGSGIAIELAEGYAAFVQPRSGLAARHGVTVLNSPGLIDSGYRGEIKVVLLNTDPDAAFEVARGDRIAQLVIQKVETPMFEEVVKLSDSERGSGGFGHTGHSATAGAVDHGPVN